ncbi:hypothetical protein E8E13_006055 [Curvularia kusanoi]|uniref:Uncharacterized protein n=1 Tax=Curvularia kusanoi TaxID=90978 RepID=A0A9P4WBX2_CURKU|nr:hypothetical protein E8E13_006055 [Curvularia kusanoi]
MSSPATQYVYIPNLVGRQMLRIPLEDVAAEDIITFSSTVSQASTESMETAPSHRVLSDDRLVWVDYATIKLRIIIMRTGDNS